MTASAGIVIRAIERLDEVRAVEELQKQAWGMTDRDIVPLTELVAVLSERAPDGLDPVFAPLWKDAPDDAARLRVVIDQVASLTDTAAVAWHERLLAA